ncbi:hypothetical protein RJT34_03630 [Clitoria ternatea]|uniref:Uncharacterized protein n=1 Tax=Clitoria ternatea TaxID=43366 RepID=A0AAN9KMJ8_CLITE
MSKLDLCRKMCIFAVANNGSLHFAMLGILRIKLAISSFTKVVYCPSLLLLQDEGNVVVPKLKSINKRGRERNLYHVYKIAIINNINHQLSIK